MERPLTTGQSGVALVITVAVVTLITVIATTTVSIVTSDLADARRSNARTAARVTAEAAVSDVFSRVIADSAYFESSSGKTPPYREHPAYAPNWATFQNGALVPCTDPFAQVCVQITVTVAQQPGDQYAAAATVQAVAATLCPSGTAHLDTCVADAVRQRLNQRQFFDYLYLDDLDTLDPALYPAARQEAVAKECAQVRSSRPTTCTLVPFLRGDEIDGPIHTNDDSFASCLDPTFRPGLDRAGWPGRKSFSTDSTPLEATGSSVFVRAPEAACAGSFPDETPPGIVQEVPEAPSYSFAVDVSDLAAIAGPADAYTGTTTITLSGGPSGGTDTYVAGTGALAPGTGASAPWPGHGIIFVAGDAYVSGTACDPVSIAATGHIFIDGDLTYGSSTDCPNASIGLEADDAVVVLPTAGPAGPAINGTSDRTVEAAVLALGKHSCFAPSAGGVPAPPGVTCGAESGDTVDGGSFYVKGWDSTPIAASATPHVLHFLGAIASIWRGAIGAFDPASGRLVSGWAKDFAFDRQLRTSQPPYFLSPVGAGWARSDLEQVGTPS